MRQRAWLTAPVDEPRPKGAKAAGDPVSRQSRMRERKEKPLLPKNPAPYLAAWLFEIGPAVTTGQGMIEIGWDTLRDWQQTMGVALKPWEARLLKRLSRDYVGQWYDSRKPDCPAPYAGTRADLASNRSRVGATVSDKLRALARERKAQRKLEKQARAR